MNQWWLNYWRIYASLGLIELNMHQLMKFIQRQVYLLGTLQDKVANTDSIKRLGYETTIKMSWIVAMYCFKGWYDDAVANYHRFSIWMSKKQKLTFQLRICSSYRSVGRHIFDARLFWLFLALFQFVLERQYLSTQGNIDVFHKRIRLVPSERSKGPS